MHYANNSIKQPRFVSTRRSWKQFHERLFSFAGIFETNLSYFEKHEAFILLTANIVKELESRHQLAKSYLPYILQTAFTQRFFQSTLR